MLGVRGGIIMTDEQIKEIVVAAINNGFVYKHESNEKNAEELAKFINVLRKETEESL